MEMPTGEDRAEINRIRAEHIAETIGLPETPDPNDPANMSRHTLVEAHVSAFRRFLATVSEGALRESLPSSVARADHAEGKIRAAGADGEGEALEMQDGRVSGPQGSEFRPAGGDAMPAGQVGAGDSDLELGAATLTGNDPGAAGLSQAHTDEREGYDTVNSDAGMDTVSAGAGGDLIDGKVGDDTRSDNDTQNAGHLDQLERGGADTFVGQGNEPFGLNHLENENERAGQDAGMAEGARANGDREHDIQAAADANLNQGGDGVATEPADPGAAAAGDLAGGRPIVQPDLAHGGKDTVQVPNVVTSGAGQTDKAQPSQGKEEYDNLTAGEAEALDRPEGVQHQEGPTPEPVVAVEDMTVAQLHAAITKAGGRVAKSISDKGKLRQHLAEAQANKE